MFAKAYSLVKEFMKPVIIPIRFYDGSVGCNAGNFIILNDEGWIVTVAHLFNSSREFQKHKKEIAEFESLQKTIREAPSLTAKQKSKRLRSLKPNVRWITNHSFWWGKDGVSLKDVKVLSEADLLVGRIEPFESTFAKAYPTIKDPTTNMNPGTSLCRLGFPFYEPKVSFNEETGTFNLAETAFPLFPLEGIFTRNVSIGRSRDGRYENKFLETSSPGLRGHSGGPIFDTKGAVWAIQSRTHHFPLGFSPKVKKDGKEVEENQFLNVGWGIHPEVIVAFLQDNGIRFKLSDY